MTKSEDVKNKFSWQGVISMLLTLCDETADISFEYRTVGDIKTPAISFRLDQPQKLMHCVKHGKTKSDVRFDIWDGKKVYFAESDESEGDLDGYIIRNNGAAGITYRSFLEMLRVIEQFDKAPEFVWSSMLLAPVSEDEKIEAEKENILHHYGAIHTIWMDGLDDETIKDTLKKVEPCGQIRVQNMSSANTWIKDDYNDNKLIKVL